LLAFDAIYNSVGLTNLTAEMGFDVRQYICDNLFFDEAIFSSPHPVDMPSRAIVALTRCLPQVARVLNLAGLYRFGWTLSRRDGPPKKSADGA